MRIGIDLGGTKIEGIALDGSREVARRRVNTPRDDYAATVEAIAVTVETLEQRSGATGSVGIGIPGTVSRATGLVKNANSVWLIGKPLRHDLQHRLARDIRIANDANCLAVSEATDGAGAGAGVVFAAIIGTGTGAGIVANGRVLEGPNGIAGEWGHNSLPWPRDDERPGPACYCGQQGCIETFVSGPGLAGDYSRHTGRTESPARIVSLAAGGDGAAEASLARYEDRLARALASVINVLDPDVVVLGGGLSNIDRLYANVPALWGQHIFACGANPAGFAQASLTRLAPQEEVRTPHEEARTTHEEARTTLVRAVHGDSSGVRGAAWLW